MRAQFEVRPLDASATHVYPEEAIKCSSSAIDMLNVLHGEVEDARNACKSIQRSYLDQLMLRAQYCPTLPCILETSLSDVTTPRARLSGCLLY